jgi:hypothetical protein
LVRALVPHVTYRLLDQRRFRVRVTYNSGVEHPDGVARVEIAGGHEVYVSDPSVLTSIVTGASA